MRFNFVFLFHVASFLTVAQSADDRPFQVLVSEGATIGDEQVEPLQFVDDVTSIDIAEGGFLSLVHKGGTTFEKREKIFTFYLKSDPLKNLEQRPDIGVLYEDSLQTSDERGISVLFPVFDRSGYIEWDENQPFDLFWHVPTGSMPSYIVTVNDNQGNKIQDFRTKLHKYLLEPSTYGLADGQFSFKIKSSFAGETLESKTYTVQLKSSKSSRKAADHVLKALELEPNPALALPAWQQALQDENCDFYKALFVKFLNRNRKPLSTAGVDVDSLLLQNK